MTYYNMTLFANQSTGLAGLMQATNDILLGGTLGILILIGFTSVVFMGLYFGSQDVKKSMVATLFISFIFSLGLSALNILDLRVLFGVIILYGGALALTWNS